MCQNYYKSFGISISIKKDKKYNKKWWIKLKVDNPENKILFPSYNYPHENDNQEKDNQEKDYDEKDNQEKDNQEKDYDEKDNQEKDYDDLCDSSKIEWVVSFDEN